uniref:Uncharacterized protein n=1 Tax=Arundo donax TaxID=35708 RepID=A0A0A9ARD3_ARUDO
MRDHDALEEAQALSLEAHRGKVSTAQRGTHHVVWHLLAAAVNR